MSKCATWSLLILGGPRSYASKREGALTFSKSTPSDVVIWVLRQAWLVSKFIGEARFYLGVDSSMFPRS